MACPAGFTFDGTPRMVTAYAAATELHQPGDIVRYMDYDIVWTKNHMRASELEPLRMIGDPLSDEAMAALNIKPGQDALQALKDYTARPESEQESAAPRMLLEQAMKVPEWVDWKQIRRGQEVYWRYIMFFSYAFVHFSLVGGYSVPKVAKVLTSTGYLSGAKTQERVLETGQFVLDMVDKVENLIPGSGICWESIVQVRFLHSGVRTRLTRLSKAHSKYYNVEDHGVPINQEDMVATMFSLSSAIWKVLEMRLGVQMTEQEKEDYLHLWKYVGFVMGVQESVMDMVMASPAKAEAVVDSIVLHLSEPNEASGALSLSVLKGLAHPYPAPIGNVTAVLGTVAFINPLKLHMALSELLLGSVFWKQCGLPAISIRYRILRKMMTLVLWMDLWLITRSPWWMRKVRNPILHYGQYKTIATVMGPTRSKFVMKAMPKDNAKGYDGEGVMEGGEGKKKVWPKVAKMAVTAAFCAAVVFPRRAGRARLSVRI